MNRKLILINSLGIEKEKFLSEKEGHSDYIKLFAEEFGIKIQSKNPVYDAMYLLNFQIVTFHISGDEIIIYMPYVISNEQYNLIINHLNVNQKYIVVKNNCIRDLYQNYLDYDDVIAILNQSLDNYIRINERDIFLNGNDIIKRKLNVNIGK